VYFWAFTAILTAVVALWLFVMALRASLDALEILVSNLEERLDRRITLLEEDIHGRNPK